MEFLSNILVACGALVAAFYCLILSRRLRKFTDLKSGIGGAVASLGTKVEDLDTALHAAQLTATRSVSTLEDVSERAETAARHLELLVASLHSLPDANSPTGLDTNPFRARRPSERKMPPCE